MNFDKQKIFNRATRHLMKQFKKAVDPKTGTCAYRTPDGLSCALGCLITDDIYNKGIEGRAIFGSVLNVSGTNLQASEQESFRQCIEKATAAKTLEDFVFLGELQHVHDRSYPNEWRDKLRTLAKEHGLTFPHIRVKAK